ncbi:MAG: GntR family transcriptional regulator [Bacillota bacterium]
MSIQKVKKRNASQIVKKELVELIKEGYFEDGLLPSEEMLGSKFGVSRITIRDALASLENLKYISRAQGKGTMINKNVAALGCRICEGIPFKDLVSAQGYQVSWHTFPIEKTVMPDFAQERLQTDASHTYCIKTLYYANGVPALYSINYLPPEIVDDAVFHLPLDRKGLFECLNEKYEFPETSYDIIEIEPICAEETLSGLFQVPVHTALLLLKSVCFDSKQTPLLFTYEYYNTSVLPFKEVRNAWYY